MFESARQQLGPAVKAEPGPAHKGSIARAQAAGREARSSVPRRDFGTLTLPLRDPVGILEGQHATRLADLIPVRVGRMLQTPFSLPSSSGMWAAAKPLTMRWRSVPAAMRTKRRQIMRRWRKPSNPDVCPLNAEFNS